MNTSNFLFTTFGIGLVFSLLAVLVERILIITGFVRGNTVGLILASFLLVVLKQLLVYNSSLYIFGLFIIVAGPIGANRYDLANTIRKGRWWWKTNNHNGDA
jgi:hypothetical protein